jgi:hypothetical protein
VIRLLVERDLGFAPLRVVGSPTGPVMGFALLAGSVGVPLFGVPLFSVPLFSVPL